MYLNSEFDSPKRRRRSSPWRIVVLLALIGLMLYVYGQIQEEEITSPFVPTPTPTRSAASFAQEAGDFYWQGDITQAIATYRRAIELEPGNASLYVPLARLLITEGYLFEASQVARRAVELAPDSAPAAAVLCMAHDWNGHVERAVETCLRAVELDPSYAEAYAYLAEAYADAGRWTEAGQAAETALQLDARSVDAYRDYGYLLEVQGAYYLAIEQYQRAAEIHPRLAFLYTSIARNYLGLSNYDAALEACRQAIEIQPDCAPCYDQLGWTYYSMGEFDKASIELERALQLNPQLVSAYGHLGLAYYGRRYYEDAAPTLETGIQMSLAQARQATYAFQLVVQSSSQNDLAPVQQTVLSGLFEPLPETPAVLQAALIPAEGETWAQSTGLVTLDSATGHCSVSLQQLPRLPAGQAYVGFFDGLFGIDGSPMTTGVLPLTPDGVVQLEMSLSSVKGPSILYYNTLGLCYYYMDRCEQAIPCFRTALQIAPDDPTALQGYDYCR